MSEAQRSTGWPGGTAVPPPRDLSVLKRHVRARLAGDHPFRIAVEALPDSISQDEFLVHLRILLPLARIEGA
jgi:hypothetical protein